MVVPQPAQRASGAGACRSRTQCRLATCSGHNDFGGRRIRRVSHEEQLADPLHSLCLKASDRGIALGALLASSWTVVGDDGPRSFQRCSLTPPPGPHGRQPERSHAAPGDGEPSSCSSATSPSILTRSRTAGGMNCPNLLMIAMFPTRSGSGSDLDSNPAPCLIATADGGSSRLWFIHNSLI